MAIQANSTPMSERLLLRDVAGLGRLLPAAQPSSVQRAELLAILDAGPITPAEVAFLSRQHRKRALLSVEALIDLLDALDGDCDLEPDADLEDGGDEEHSLGSPELGSSLDVSYGRIARVGTLNQEHWAMGSRCQLTSEAEVVDEDGGDILDEPHDEEPDGEPSLGAPDRIMDQRRWSSGHSWDREQDGRRRARRERVRSTETPQAAAYRMQRDLARLSGGRLPEASNLRPVLLPIF